MLRSVTRRWPKSASSASRLRTAVGPFARGRAAVDKVDSDSNTCDVPQSGVVLAVCTADAYDMARIDGALSSAGALRDSLAPHRWVQHDAVLLSLRRSDKDATETAPTANESDARAFVFASGCVVVWAKHADATAAVARLCAALAPYARGEHVAESNASLHNDDSRVESLDYETDSVPDAILRGETVVVPNAKDAAHIMAAVSHGLAVSVRLAMLEERLEQHAAASRDIPAALASGLPLRVSRSDVLRMTGELLAFRADLNMHSDAGEACTPDRYWSAPRLASAYDRVARCLDVRPRVHALNRRLDYANELAATLRMHLSERHGLKLEWGIIALIAVEVFFEVVHFAGLSPYTL